MWEELVPKGAGVSPWTLTGALRLSIQDEIVRLRFGVQGPFLRRVVHGVPSFYNFRKISKNVSGFFSKF